MSDADPRWPEANRIYQRLLETDPEGRQAIVADACGDDDELRQTVERLLAYGEQSDPELRTGAPLRGALGEGLERELAEAAGGRPRIAGADSGALESGAPLGHYRIEDRIGAGGMGEVYRAHDTRLGRQLAIKVLPEDVATDAERLARLEREAMMLAALSHSNIAVVYGFEDDGDRRFIAMELVEGETLAERIARSGRIEIEEALEIARQIADGLEAAHDKGVVHRDLKPANVVVSPDGKVKVLDFGLAKVYETEGAPAEPSPDLIRSSAPRTAARSDVIVGTAAYMSPEQAKGRAVDRRADVWAFGCVLYEMLVGRSPFAGDTVAETMAATITREPDWEALPAATPVAIQMLLRRCLRKPIGRRLRDMGDVRIEIEDAITTPADAVPMSGAVAPVGASRWQAAAPWAVAAAAVAIAALVYVRFAPRDAPAPVYSDIFFERPPGQADSRLHEGWPVAMSREGTRIVYRFDEPGPLLLRDLARGTLTPLGGTEGANFPFFSPAGDWLGFLVPGEGLKKIRLDVDGGGNEPVVLCAGVGQGRAGGSWGPDGTIVYSVGRDGPGQPSVMNLRQVPADRPGDCTSLTTLDASRGELTHRWPQVLPGGRGVLFSNWGERYYDEGDVAVYSFETGDVERVGRGTYARYVPTFGPDRGHLIIARYNTLYAVPFDAARLRPMGAEVPVLSGVFGDSATLGGPGAAHFAVSDTGRLVYREALPFTRGRLVRVDLAGNATPLPNLPPRPYEGVRFSPAGRELALVTQEGEIYRYELDVGRASLLQGPFLDSAGMTRRPRFVVEWASDGKALLVYTTSGTTGPPLFLLRLDAEEEPRAVPTTTKAETYPVSLLSDPDRVLYYSTGSTGRGVREVSLDADGSDSFFMDEVLQVALSADDRLMAYWTSPAQVFVREYDGSAPARQVSIEGGASPVWGPPESRMLYFRDGESVWAAEISTEPTLEAGEPRPLFPDTYFPGWGWRPRTYDLSPDGRTFVMIEELEEPPRTEHLRMIDNWFEELARQAPVQR